MKQWIVKKGSTSLDGLVLLEVPTPDPGLGQVRVRMRAASLNRRDHLLATGAFGAAQQDFVALSDGAGEIDAVGEGVENWSVGDRVTGEYYAGWEDGPPAEGMGWGLGSPGDNGVLAEFTYSQPIASRPPPRRYPSRKRLRCLARP